MWILVSIFISSLEQPPLVMQVKEDKFFSQSACEATLVEFLDWPDSIMAKDEKGTFIKSKYTKGSRYAGSIAYVRCLRIND